MWRGALNAADTFPPVWGIPRPSKRVLANTTLSKRQPLRASGPISVSGDAASRIPEADGKSARWAQPRFVKVYIDDVTVFSPTHLEQVGYGPEN